MAIPKRDYVKPYDDNFMKYDYSEHRYKLTVEGAQESHIDMIDIWINEEYLSQYLDLLSRTLYSVFLKNKDSKYHDKQLWLLAHSKHYRKSIYKLFQDVIWYNHTSGGFMTLYQSGINLNEMKKLDMHIEDAMSVVGNNFAQTTGINERIPRYRATELNDFDSFEDLKDFLIEKNIFTKEDLDNVEKIEDIPLKTMYTIYFNQFNDKYCVEDYNYWNKMLEVKGREW